MYNQAAMPATGAGMLAYAGGASLWLVLAAFALMAAGLAVWRMVPRSEA